MILALSDFDLNVTQDFLGEDGRRAGFVLLTAFLLSFLFIRTSARLMRSPKVPWWPGSVHTSSGLHVHHLVWGIITVLLAGFLGFSLQPGPPWLEILAVLFGIGMGLTLDEFALWLRLEDVYWSEQGRSSIEAVVVATIIGALIVLGLAPFDLADERSITAIVVAVAFHVFLAVVCIYKGKPVPGVVGLVIPFVGLVGAITLATPGSAWARRFYAPGGAKERRAEQRHRWWCERRDRLSDMLFGAPADEPRAELGSASGAPADQPRAELGSGSGRSAEVE